MSLVPSPFRVAKLFLSREADQVPSPTRVAASAFKNKKTVKTQDGKEMVVYEYSDAHNEKKYKEKAERVEGLRKDLPKLQAKYRKDLSSDDAKTRLIALAIALLDETYERVGNDGSAEENEHYGVTTWEKKHLSFSGGKAIFKYVGKSGVDHVKEVTDAKVVSALKEVVKGKKDGDRILCSKDKDSECTVSAGDVNQYLSEFEITAKDMRGLHANEEMKTRLKAIRSKGGKIPSDKKEKEKVLKEEFKEALEGAAEAVGHAPSMLRSSYLVPGLEDQFVKDGTILEKLSKKGSARTAAYDFLRHCPDCQCILHDGPRFYEHCEDCGYDLKAQDEMERRKGQDWQPLSETDPRLIVLRRRRVEQLSWVNSLLGKFATKTETEKDDAEAERLIKPSPKLKPPRNDLRRRKVTDTDSREKDPDVAQEERDNPKPSKAASASRVALMYMLLASVEKTDGGRFKATRPDGTSDYFDTKEEANTWLSSSESETEDPNSATKEELSKEFLEKGVSKETLDTALSMLDKDGVNVTEVRALLEENAVEVATKKKQDLAAAKAQAKELQKAERAKEKERKKKEQADPLFDADNPIPESSDAGQEGYTSAHREALVARTMSSIERWRSLEASDRKAKADLVETEIEDLDDGDPRKEHLEAVLRGIRIGGAIKDGGEVQGVGSAAVALIRAADKSGDLRDLAEIAVIGSKSSGTSDDQAVIRRIYENLPSDEWVNVLPEDHPGRDLAELLADPHESRFMTPADRLEVSNMLMDMQVADLNFVDPAVSRSLPPGATADAHGSEAKKLRLKAVTQPLTRPKTSGGVKKVLSAMQEALRNIIGMATKGEDKHDPGDVWPKSGKFWAKAKDGTVQGFDSKDSADEFARSDPAAQ